MVHDDGGTAKADSPERISAVVCQIFEDQIAPEAGRAAVQNLRMKGLFHKSQDFSQIPVAVIESDASVFIIPVGGPVKNDKGRVAVLSEDFIRQQMSCPVVFIPTESVAEHNDVTEGEI